MKTLTKSILVFLLVLIMTPIFSVFFYSFYNTEMNSVFHWYDKIIENGNFLNALWLSVKISFFTSLIATFLGFILSLSWFNTKQRYSITMLIVILGLVPPDIIALGISKLSQLLNLQGSNLFFTLFALVLYTLPFIILLLWSRYYFINEEIIKSARDLGMKNKYINLKIVLPMSFSALVSVTIFSFILSFNEYPRTYYLSGYHNFLSEYLYGKLNSGLDESIYAGSSITIIITSVFLVITFLFMKLNAKKE